MIRFTIYLMYLMFVAVGSSWAAEGASESLEDLKTHYSNVKQQLDAAEHIPGAKGLDQVRYYQGQLEALQKQLEAQGVSLENDKNMNTPWTGPTNVLDHVTALGLTEESLQEASPLDQLKDELQKLDLDISTLTQHLETPGVDQNKIAQDMNAMLEKKYELTQKIQDIENNPGLTALMTQKEADVTQAKVLFHKKDAHYVQQVQEQLQKIYEAIYLLRAQSVASREGAQIQKIGLDIADLEKQEIKLKQQLTAMGEKPLPPQVLSPEGLGSKGIISQTDPEKFKKQLEDHLKEIDDKLVKVHDEINGATSGAQIAQLGIQLTNLQQQRFFVERMLSPTKPKLPYEVQGQPQGQPKDVPVISLRTPWGQAKNVPDFFQVSDSPAASSSYTPSGPFPQQPAFGGSFQAPPPQPAPSFQLWDLPSSGQKPAQAVAPKPVLTAGGRPPSAILGLAGRI